MMIDMLPYKFFYATRLETTSKSNSLLSLAVFLLFVLLAAQFHSISSHSSHLCSVSYFCMLKDSSAVDEKYPNFQPLYYFQCASVLCNPSNINFPKLQKGNIITYLWIERARERGQDREVGSVIISRRANWMRMWLLRPSSPQLTDVSHTSLVTSH